MPGPICIVTPTGVIVCEATSYHRPYYDGQGKAKDLEVSKDDWKGKKMDERIAKLMELAHVRGAPFMIIKRPKDA